MKKRFKNPLKLLRRWLTKRKVWSRNLGKKIPQGENFYKDLLISLFESIHLWYKKTHI